MSGTVETDTLTEKCLTVGRALTLAVPDSGMAEGCSTSSTLSANKWEMIRFSHGFSDFESSSQGDVRGRGS